MEHVYREQLLDHYRNPRNFGEVDGFHCHAEADNPLCGDRIFMGVYLDGSTVREAGFHGRGCAVCMAAASLLTDHVRGLEIDSLYALQEELHQALARPDDVALPAPLDILSPLREHPARHRCVLLPMDALLRAVMQSGY